MSLTRPAPARVPTTARPLWVTDGGLEADLIHHHGVDLPGSAAFPLLGTTEGRALLTSYYSGFAQVARRTGTGLLLETPTWRANPDWVVALGGSPQDVRRINLESVVFLAGLGEMLLASGALSTAAKTGTSGRQSDDGAFQVRGVIGPKGNGYLPERRPTAEEFADYHSVQAAALCDGGVSWVTAYTLSTLAEAVGVVRAARAHSLKVGICFTVESDGRLPDGSPVAAAVEELWQRSAPDGLLLNCASPSHIVRALEDDGWGRLVTGLRVDASGPSHAELDSSEQLDEGDLQDLVRDFQRLTARLPNLEVVGGCCGSDARHIAELLGVRD